MHNSFTIEDEMHCLIAICMRLLCTGPQPTSPSLTAVAGVAELYVQDIYSV